MKRLTRWFVIALLFIFVLAWNTIAGAVQLDEMGCMNYAVWSGDIVWAREVGADKDKVRVFLIEMADQDETGVLRLVLREFEHLWATRADRIAVGQIVLRDCFARRGRYEETGT